jgi:hypothetical protein
VRKQACANSAAVSVSCQCYNRNTHPQGFASGGGSVVRKSVKGNVDAVVNVEMISRTRNPTQQFYLFLGNTGFQQTVKKPIPR